LFSWPVMHWNAVMVVGAKTLQCINSMPGQNNSRYTFLMPHIITVYCRAGITCKASIFCR